MGRWGPAGPRLRRGVLGGQEGVRGRRWHLQVELGCPLPSAVRRPPSLPPSGCPGTGRVFPLTFSPFLLPVPKRLASSLPKLYPSAPFAFRRQFTRRPFVKIESRTRAGEETYKTVSNAFQESCKIPLSKNPNKTPSLPGWGNMKASLLS